LGLTAEWQPLKEFSVEVNGLYRPLHFSYENLISIQEQGVVAGKKSRSTVLTWEFPLLSKYRLPAAGVKTFIEAGPSFRSSGNLNGTDPSHYGITTGGEFETRAGKMKLSPAVRYSRWARDRRPDGGTNPSQVELVVGFSF
jgi:hypothetical protein